MAAGKVALRTFQKRKDLEEEGESQAKSPPCCGSEETKELQRPGAGPGAGAGVGKGTAWSAMAWESVVSTEGRRLASLEQKSVVIGLVFPAGSLTPEESSCRRNTGGRGGVLQARGGGAWAHEDTSPRAGALSAMGHVVGLQQIAELLKTCLLLYCPALMVSSPRACWAVASFWLVRRSPAHTLGISVPTSSQSSCRLRQSQLCLCIFPHMTLGLFTPTCIPAQYSLCSPPVTTTVASA